MKGSRIFGILIPLQNMTESLKTPKSVGIFSLVVIVAAMGYFVDLYDLLLFNVIRDKSLIAIGYTDSVKREAVGDILFNLQMFGMLIGGIIWGILGDTKGRLRVLFGSILLYSLANIANGFVQDINTYYVLRFIAGIGLAGELGAGVTLIAESLPKAKRGIGTMIVVAFGAFGAVTASYVGLHFDWRNAYFIGGGLGLLLLALRVGVYESGMYENIKHAEVKKGAFLSLFTNRERAFKYLKSILIGLPVWFTIGILVIKGPLLAKDLGIHGDIVRGQCIMYSYIGLSFGDILSGLLSQALKSRKKTVLIFMCTSVLSFIMYFLSKGASANTFYFICFILGAATGYWAIFVTVASEQFGTNLRSTVTTTVPNFVRGMVYLLNFGFAQLAATSLGNIGSAIVLGIISISLATLSISTIHESFNKDLDYTEDII